MSSLLTKSKTNLKKIIFNLRWSTGVPIFVYQMGKVASSSIYRSLFEQYLRGNVIHGHHFRPQHYYWQVEKLYKYYDDNKPIKIISPIREPIGRNVSAFFHNSFHNPEKKKVAFNLNDTPLGELKNIFLEYYDHEWPLNWFDNNIKKHFHIDVYEYKFPQSGYLELKKKNTELLLLKHDLKNETKEEIIKEFTGLNSFHLKSLNKGSGKKYADKYVQFKKQVRLPDWYLDKMVKSKYFQHFYTQEEINAVIAKWKCT